MNEYNGTYEFVFFHDQKKGEIIVIMNGQKHVFDDGVSKAVKAERERIAKWAEEVADEYGKLDLFDILDQVEEPHIGAKHDPDCNLSQGKWDGGCTCKSDPRRLEVSKTSAKKSEVVDRTTSERKYCAIDQFYYSEMFTCPICYGVEQERERIIKLLEPLASCDPELCGDNGEDHYPEDCSAFAYQYAIDLIKGDSDE